MTRIKIKVNGKEKQYEKGISLLDIAKDMKNDKAIAAKLDGKLVDLNTKINSNAKVEFLTFEDKDGKEIFRHSAAHVLAHAIKRLFPKAQLTIGPAVEDGFYYDIDNDKPFTPEDLKKLEREMHKIVKESHDFERLELAKKDAIKEAKKRKELYKVEMIEEIGDDKVTFYKQGEFTDFCLGPHVPSTGFIKGFKLMKIAGAYWRGDAKNKQLQRIYGVAFPTKEELKEYIKLLEEAQKRDHRELGKRLNLFSFHEEAPGFPFFHAKGTVIYDELERFKKEEMIKRGYQLIKTPLILNKELWKRSGHWDHFKDDMYFIKIDNKDFAIKPMNCPGCMLVYKSKLHSYRELPLRIGEMGLVHRHELSGVLSGLFRVRAFVQDDAHVFCTEEQLEDEIIALIDFTDFLYKTFGFGYDVELSTMPEKAMGSKKIWDKAEIALENALKKKKIDYKINKGEGAFYGPKIDFHIKDAINRSWQCGTIQVDFSMPEKFDLTYDGKDGKKHKPVMIHRALYGSIERLMGILIEHYAGKFPLWMSPIQVRVLTLSESFEKYSREVYKKLFDAGIRVEFDNRAESISKKVREAQVHYVNYALIVGEKEMKNKTVNVRTRDNKILGEKKIDAFIKELKKEIEEKR